MENERLKIENGAVPQLRVAVGRMSYSELGRRIGITRQAVSKMLREDDKDLMCSTIVKLATAVGWHLELVKDE